MATVAVTNIPAQTWINNSNAQWVGNIPSSVTDPLNGIAISNSRWYFKMVDFNGDTVYQNSAFNSTPAYTTPDLSGITATWLTSIPVMPTSSAGKIIKGLYTVYCIQRDQTQVVTDLFLQTFTFNFQYEPVTISVQTTIQLFNPPSISITDLTNYNLKDPQDGAWITPTLARAWSLYYPSSLERTKVTSTSISVQTNDVWSGSWEVALDSTLVYTFDTSVAANFLLILDLVEYVNDDIRIPNTNLNSLYCCVKHAEDRYKQSIGTQAEAQNLSAFSTAMDYYTLIGAAIQNGVYANVMQYIEDLKEVAQCNDECDCNDDGPEQLTGWGTQNITQKIEEIADGATAAFPTELADQAILKNKSYANNDFALFDSGTLIPSMGAGSTMTFNATTGICTLNYTPSNGSVITILIFK